MPPSLAGQPVEDVAAQGRDPARQRSGRPPRARRRRRAPRGRCRASAAVSRPGPQPTSTVWPRQWPRSARSACVRLAAPEVRRAAPRARRAARSTVHGLPAQRGAEHLGERRPLLRQAVLDAHEATLPRPRRTGSSAPAAPPASASAHRVDVAQRGGGARPRGRPRPARAGCRRTSSAWTWARPCSAAAAAGSRSASTHQPPSSAGPEHRVVVGQPGGGPEQQLGGDLRACPCRPARPVRGRAAWASASRAAKLLPTLAGAPSSPSSAPGARPPPTARSRSPESER